MKRVGENPPARFPNRAPSEAEGPWWVAKIKPRQEKAVAFDLLREEIEYYLPMYTHVVRRRDNNKPRKSILPLFPGYISYCASRGFERLIFKSGRVVNLVPVRNQKRFAEELEQIYRSIESGVSLQPVQTYEPGDFVVVRRGPLRGITGTVTRISNETKLVLSVEGLGRAAMSVDSALVQPVGG